MSVNYRLNVWSFLINSHVHLDFGRRLESFVSLKHFAVFIDFADELGSHESLRYARGGAKKFVIVEFNGNISVVRSDHALVVNTSSDVTDLFFDFKFVYHVYLLEVFLVCILLYFVFVLIPVVFFFLFSGSSFSFQPR